MGHGGGSDRRHERDGCAGGEMCKSYDERMRVSGPSESVGGENVCGRERTMFYVFEPVDKRCKVGI